MDTPAYLNAVVEQTSTFADWVHGKDAAAPVPTCPIDHWIEHMDWVNNG
ncbi:hypothetical protein AB0L53_57735 [Nonomuraea sp. NPDC052129]